MGKQAAKKATLDFLNMARSMLQSDRTTEDDRDNLSFIEANLNESHMQAALWLQRKHAMRLDSPNLGNLISVWDNALSVSTVLTKHPQTLVMMMMDRVIGEGEFHPVHLIRYFKKNGSVPNSPPPKCQHFRPTVH